MKKLGLLLFVILAVALLGGNAVAQNVGDNSVYFVTYFSNANTTGAQDGTLRIVNDGTQATASPDGNTNGALWAAIYVFDDSQEMIACCACLVSADGLLSESVNQQLVNYTAAPGNPIIGTTFTDRGEFARGVIKVISSSSSDPTAPVPVPGLRGWATHIQATSETYKAPWTFTPKGPFFVTEAPLADSNLSTTELGALGAVCSYGLQDQSGYGYCGCSKEDYDF